MAEIITGSMPKTEGHIRIKFLGFTKEGKVFVLKKGKAKPENVTKAVKEMEEAILRGSD